MSSLFKELDYLRIPFADIKSATDEFNTCNIIERFQTRKRGIIIVDEVDDHYIYKYVYRGKLFRFGKRINVIVETTEYMTEEDLLKGVLVLSRFKHKNIPTFIGFCYTYRKCYLVSECDYDCEIIGSLDQILNVLSVPNINSNSNLEYVYKNLTCSQRLEICLDAARALSHIHDCHAIHADFRSAKILLDKDLEVKVVGSVIIPIRYPNVEFTVKSDYKCYTDPVCNITKSMTHKSDVYSFGVVLIDMFCEQYAKTLNRKKFTEAPEIHHSDFDDNIRKQMHREAFTILSETINKCLNREREERPNMAEVGKQLEKTLFLQWKHDKPMLQKIGLDEIKSATNNFDETYLIGSGGFGMVYKAELNLFDAKFFMGTAGKIEKEISKKPNLSYKQFVPGTEGKIKKEISEKPAIFDAKFFWGTEGKIKKPNQFDAKFVSGKEDENQKKIPKKYKTTAIKRILIDEKGHGRKGFFLEIEMLRRCEHPNIVSLLGYCNEHSELILVYEFVPNGSLDDYLESTKKETYLTWVQRIKLCLDIAHGLDYLHTNMTDKEIIIHRDIKSANILLGNNWEAKIADFGLSKFYSANQLRSTIVTNNIAGTEVYLDPEYSRTGHLKKQSDIYSFGVVLFEILSGTLAYEKIYIDENNKGIAAVARRHFSEGTLMEMVDPEVMEEAEQLCFGLKVGPNQKSIKSFLEIAFQCIAETQDERPTLKDIINELEIALNLQEKRKDILKFSLEEIKFGTQNFSDKNFFRKEEFGKVYRGELPYDNERKTVVFKVSRKEHNFQRELEILAGHKHENIIDIVGYCNEKDEKIIVYENAYNGNTLDKHVNDISLTWIKRLEICVGIANGLKFLHKGFARQQYVVHGDIKSANIVLNGNWIAKICCFEFSLINSKHKDMEYVIHNVDVLPGYSDPVYCDPVYKKTGYLTKESDIYSFGLILFEMLCGKLACLKDFRESKQFLDFLVDELVFEGIQEQIALKSLATFGKIAYQCLHEEREKRPTANEVYMQLKKALDIQVISDISNKKVSNVNASRGLEDKLLVKKDLYSLRLEEGEDLKNHIVTFDRLVCELSNMEEIIKEEDLALILLSSLPKSYKRFVDNMLLGSTDLKLRDVFQNLGDHN